MNLRRQLMLVSLLTLVLPWAGCQFVRETETALRSGQQQMLAGTAKAIADSLAQPEIARDFRRFGSSTFAEGQIYGHRLTRAPEVDGYYSDWLLSADSLRTLRGTGGTIRFAIGLTLQDLYLYVEVPDANVVYASAGTPVEDADHIVLHTAAADGEGWQFVFAAEAPGRVAVQRADDVSTVDDTQVRAYWEDTARGYQLEARIPRRMIDLRLGLEVISNGDAGRPVSSQTYTRNSPGKLISPSTFLASVADGYVQAQNGMRLMITDPVGWRLARAGTLTANGSASTSVVPEGWQQLLYRLLMERGPEAALAEPAASGREQQQYIVRALNGEDGSADWFRNRDSGRAVVAVAEPVWLGNEQLGALVLQQDTDAILSLTNETLLRFITLTVLATAIAALALLGYATWLSLRIRRLSHAAEHALDSGQPSSDLPSATASDEVGDLSRSFSNVLQQVASYNEYLRSLASKLSHEMRTPLTIVMSSLENLEHEPLNEQSREYTERAQTGARRLRKILNAMSEANRVEQLMENADTEVFNLGKVLETTVAAYRDAWPQRKFAFTSDGGNHQIDGSPELLIQMLDKLVDNAVDFSDERDEIGIAIANERQNIVMSVSNPGPPLPKAMRHRLFESMVSMRDDATAENLGLGLNIAKLIADGHGGSIGADNIDGGVKFEVRLPAA